MLLRIPLGAIVLGVLLHSTGPVLAQATSVSGPVFAFWRLWFGVIVFGVAAAVHTAITRNRIRLRAFRWALMAGLAFGTHQLLLFTAIKATSVADVTLVTTLSPIVTAMMAAPFFRERPGRVFRLWSIVAMVGSSLVILGASTGPDGNLTGMLLAIMNVVAFASFFLLSKASRADLPVILFLFGVMGVSAVVVTAYIMLSGADVLSADSTDLAFAAILAVGPGAIGHFVMTWPLRWVPANVPPVMRLGQPLLAGLWARWFLEEPITLWHVIGGILTTGGVGGAILCRSGRAFISEQARRAGL